MSQCFTDSFDRSVGQLLELHRVTIAGGEESVEADAIRESMDVDWWDLSPKERDLVRGLSADLFTIGVDRPVPDRDPNEDVP
jgi:hypothetical protein